ncbi:DUF3885 domain-containing protein [Segniliparus rugosus]|uniref:DUF3885 domain-containing protein n=1 Tax=Segniliparus rugosus (strain ATCC BAA-974 / DSM 45345 / CCUG 50838 / CIP 108380 / JCM 13579 / CDC 945) TaxID=679197 RepID=E5XU20_SEGRC|nr:hypothetical protein [Segniliparus rugosus]EFV12189.1 hypothetical protein HMPREF9336_02992 [Segniliparus rugosus ATCC BAA-974]
MIDPAELARAQRAWETRWPGERPIGHYIPGSRGQHVRFYSLPHKRYVETPEDLRILLARHNTLFGEFFAPGEDLYFVFPTVEPADPDSGIICHGNPVPDEVVPGCQLWFRAPPHKDDDFETVTDFHIAKVRWRRGAFDDYLRDIDQGSLWGVLIANADFTRLAHPYDGGLDLVAPTEAEARALRQRHPTWAERKVYWRYDHWDSIDKAYGWAFLLVAEATPLVPLGEMLGHCATPRASDVVVREDAHSVIAEGRAAIRPGLVGHIYRLPLPDPSCFGRQLAGLGPETLGSYPELTYRAGYSKAAVESVREQLGLAVPEGWARYLRGPSVLQGGWMQTGNYVSVFDPQAIIDRTQASDIPEINENPGYLLIGEGDGAWLALDTRISRSPLLLTWAAEGWQKTEERAASVEEFIDLLEARVFQPYPR